MAIKTYMGIAQPLKTPWGRRSEDTTPNSSQTLIDQISQAQERTNLANKQREKEIRSILDEVIGQYRAGGGYGKGVEAQLERERTKTLATGAQSLIGAGLYNTTQLAGLGGKFAEEVAMPTRMKLEDLRMDRLSESLGQKARFIESIQEPGPDYRLLAELMSTAEQPRGRNLPYGGASIGYQGR